MNNRFNFTKAAIDSLAIPPKGKRSYYYDTKTRGLCVSISSSNTKTFVVYRKIKGKPERITVGRHPDVTIDQARRKSADKNRQLRNEINFQELFDIYLERHSKVHKRT